MACAACAQREWETRVGDLDLELDPELDGEAGGRVGDIRFEAGFEAPWGFEQPDLEIIGADARTRVTDTTQVPFRYVCNFEYNVPGRGRVAGCTGTLIGPRTVLTAGHCIDTIRPPQLRVIPGRNRTLEPLPATQAVRLIPAPGFAGTASHATSTDFGIVHLADPIGSRIGFWTADYARNPGDTVGTSILRTGTLPLPAGKLKVNLSGYPGDKPGEAAFRCRDPRGSKRRCFVNGRDRRRSPLCGTEPWKAYDLQVERRCGLLHYLNDTCPGHSGSPVWVRRHPSMGGRVLVGVHIAGDDGVGRVANRAVFITPAVRAFIVANTI
jgi:V8-like Glu-specific endopeptidase